MPQWDTSDSVNRLDRIRQSILKKCGCAKSRCVTNACSCKRNTKGGRFCTNLCTCNDCANRPGDNKAISEANNESEDEDEDGWEYNDRDGHEDGEVDEDDFEDVDDIDLQELRDLLSEDGEDYEDDEENFVNYLLA